jgi:hypothetical protein
MERKGITGGQDEREWRRTAGFDSKDRYFGLLSSGFGLG